MAKNDYFVIAYRILKYLYECFKAGEGADVEILSPEALKISNGYWVNIMRSLLEEGYIKGISFPSATGTVIDAKIYDLRITEKGIDFLDNNSNIAKAKEFLKTAVDVISGI